MHRRTGTRDHRPQYLPGGGQLFWPDPLAAADVDRLRAWWANRSLRVAAAVRTADGDELLLTHAD